MHLRADAQPKQDTYEWSETVKDETNNQLLIEASKAKGFLDYKDLLETHYAYRSKENVNVFNLLVDNLLVNTIDRLTNQTLGEEWASVHLFLRSSGAVCL